MNLKLSSHQDVYAPREDSYLFTDNLEQLRSELSVAKNILEVGIGSGIISLSSILKFPKVNHLGIDINYSATMLARENLRLNSLQNLQLIASDLMSALRRGSQFDCIFFNPPYLPASALDKYLSQTEEHALVGGEIGIETTIRFIQNAKLYSNRVVIIVSSLATSIEEFTGRVPNWSIKILATLKLDFEKLWLLSLTRTEA